jgi:glutaminyl-tRNA synthetase
MAVLDPVKVVITNYPENQVEEFEQPLHPEDTSFGKRIVPFCREIYIERDDFREDPPKKYFRLAPGAEVRLRYAYYIICQEVIKDAEGNIVEIHCTYDPESRGGSSPDGRKVKGTLHWVSACHAVPSEVRLYEQMFTTESDGDIEDGKTFLDYFNPDSEKVITAMAEPYLATLPEGSHVQFERIGYFCADPDGSKEHPVFNRTVTLKDSWAKIEKKQ